MIPCYYGNDLFLRIVTIIACDNSYLSINIFKSFVAPFKSGNLSPYKKGPIIEHLSFNVTNKPLQF